MLCSSAQFFTQYYAHVKVVLKFNCFIRVYLNFYTLATVAQIIMANVTVYVHGLIIYLHVHL